MRMARQLIILVALCATPFTVRVHVTRAESTPEPSWPAVDDGPCPDGMFGPEQGWNYVNGVWIDTFGATVGYAPEEDECIRPVHDDLAPRGAATLPVTK